MDLKNKTIEELQELQIKLNNELIRRIACGNHAMPGLSTQSTSDANSQEEDFDKLYKEYCEFVDEVDLYSQSVVVMELKCTVHYELIWSSDGFVPRIKFTEVTECPHEDELHLLEEVVPDSLMDKETKLKEAVSSFSKKWDLGPETVWEDLDKHYIDLSRE